MKAFSMLVFTALALGLVAAGGNRTPPAAGHSVPLAPALTSTPTPCVSASWSAQATYPIAVADHAVAAQGGNVYSFGGIVNNLTISNAYKYNPATDSWTAIAPLPAPRGWFSAVSDGTYVYLLGGVDQNFSTTSTLWRYDPATNTYNTSLASYTIPTYNHAAAYLNGKIYRIAGRGIGTDYHVEVYTIATNSWAPAANYPFASHSLMAAALGNYIYAGGGNSAPTKAYRYDPLTDTWDDAAVADLPVGRSAAASDAYSGRWLLAGGDVNFAISTSAIAWDPATNTWNTLPDMVQPRDYLAGATAGAAFYAVGGNSAPGTGTTDNQRYQETNCGTATATPTPAPNTVTATAPPNSPTVTAPPSSTATTTTPPVNTVTPTATQPPVSPIPTEPTVTVPPATATPTPCGQMVNVSSPNPGTVYNFLQGVSALGSNDAWAVGYTLSGGNYETLVEHWDGAVWSVITSPNVGTGDNALNAVSALAGNDVWAVGYYDDGAANETLVGHWNGTAWSVIPSPGAGGELRGVSALASDDVWAVGGDGQTLTEHWNGSAWVIVPSPNPGSLDNRLSGVSALASNDVWAVGGYGGPGGYPALVEHWNGSTWSVVPSPNISSSEALQGVSAMASNDVWAVGEYWNSSNVIQTLVEHWNGIEWSVVNSPSRGTGHNFLFGVSVPASNDVWAAGYYYNGSAFQTLVEHWNGMTWSVVPSPNPGGGDNFLFGTSALPGGNVWAVGNYGAAPRTLVEKYEGPCGTPTPTPSASPTPTSCTITFTDVHPVDYFYAPVLYLACHGVISGYSDGTFRPYANTTRSQMVKIVVLGFNKAIVTPGGSNYSFTDVTRSNPFFAVVETAAAYGIVSGYTCGVAPAGPCDSSHRPYFLPFAYVTRGQLSKIDVIAAGWTLYNPAVGHFSDVAHGSVFYTVIETAYCHGVISGYNDGTFRPFNNAIRGQIAKIVYLSITNPPVSCGP